MLSNEDGGEINQLYPHRGLSISKRVFSFQSIMVFMLPLLTAIRMNVVGELLMSDILVVSIFSFLVVRNKLVIDSRYIYIIIIFLLAWFVSAIASDIYNESTIKNSARGLFKISLFLLYILVFYSLIDKEEIRIALAILGYAIGISFYGMTALATEQASTIFGTVWKFGVGEGFILIVMLFFHWVGFSRRKVGLFTILLSPIHLYLGARSLFLRVFLAGISALASLRIETGPKRLLAGATLLFSILIVLPVGSYVYDYLVRSNIFGEKALEKHIKQSSIGEGILIGGRPELLVSYKAIGDAPILGHGSWASGQEYRRLLLDIIEAKGVHVNWNIQDPTKNSTIPSHSHLFGAWVEHGVFGGIFWLYIIWLTVVAYINGVFGPRPLHSFEALVIIGLFWDVLFSPFGASQRCSVAMVIVILITVLNRNKITREH